jgi:cytochrome c-type biogenesis protein CcmH/NrfF
MKLPLKARLFLWTCTAIMVLTTPMVALARRPEADRDIVDARLEGYNQTVSLEPKSTALVWMLFLFLAVVGLAVMFKDAKRTHLD